ncbi:MAG: hypothetical protein RI932_379 [Pseudomonadota bacterium]|jgi:hypothetical protein
MVAPILRKFSKRVPAPLLRRLLNMWPPFVGAGISIREASEDLLHIRVELKRSWYNINYVGVQFGGSIYAMVDPFYMVMLIHNLGDEYIVWDKAAEMQFLRPGRTALTAMFNLDRELLDQIRTHTSQGGKFVFDLLVEVRDAENTIVALVTKTLYVRRKK